MKYFTLKELSDSLTARQNGIDNMPTPEAVRNLTALVDNILDPLREAYGGPITVSSGYRCPAVNDLVKGARKSQHTIGQAADITVGSRKGNKVLFNLIRKLKLPFDQLIYEHGTLSEGPQWVHVSYKSQPRGQIIYERCGK